MPSRHTPRSAAARRGSAEIVRRAAGIIRAGEPLTDTSRNALVDLLENLAAAYDLVPTTVWDRTAGLALRIEEPHRAPLPDRPPNVGGGSPRGAAAAELGLQSPP